MARLSETENEGLHHLQHLAEVLATPEIARWNRAVEGENGETYRQLIQRLRRGWGRG